MNYQIEIDGLDLVEQESFHSAFQKEMGLFKEYGRNMNAWYDCMSDMYSNGEYKSLSKFDLNYGDVFTIVIIRADEFIDRASQYYLLMSEFISSINSDRDGIHIKLELKQ